MGSDHSPTLVKIDELGDPHINDYRPHSFNMTRADWSQFKRACEDSFTNGENSVDDDVDNMYEDMVQNIISAAEKCIPRTRPKCRQNDYRIGIQIVEMLYMHEIELEIK